MKKELYILFTAGRGPVECAYAVKGIQDKFKRFLKSNDIQYSIVNQKQGGLEHTLDTIVFKLELTDDKMIRPWIGTIQWVCKSPFRKFHKRKNWFIKCEEVMMDSVIEINVKDVLVQAYRASGPGGQHRNKVETAIRIVHQPTGLIVTAADGKSQAQNKKKAWQKLIDKLNIQNEELLRANSTSQWTSKLSIKRGSPIKTFTGLKFQE